ncbi:MAG: hypothetical protein U1D30_08830 [Planctomycetota bacterium]
MLRPWHALLILFGAMFFAPPSMAGLVTITDTQPIVDYPNCPCPDVKLPAVLPFALFDFSGQPKLASITGIEITLTMQDGDTLPGEFDYNKLSLGLDNVPTGIMFNGFGAGKETSLTFSLKEGDAGWLSDGAIKDLLTDLNSDNQLFALLLDATPDDNCVYLYSAFDTTIKLTGELQGGGQQVPEPASLFVWLMILVGFLAVHRRRQRSAIAPIPFTTAT